MTMVEAEGRKRISKRIRFRNCDMTMVEVEGRKRISKWALVKVTPNRSKVGKNFDMLTA
jgi:hypothetical protein